MRQVSGIWPEVPEPNHVVKELRMESIGEASSAVIVGNERRTQIMLKLLIASV